MYWQTKCTLTECLQMMKGNRQNILKSIHPPQNSTFPTNLGYTHCYASVTEAEFDNLQRKYGELSGEIVIVEITVKDIQDILTSGLRHSVASQQPTPPRSSPVTSITPALKPLSPPNPIVLKSLGISLCGNKDLNQMSVLVCGIQPGGIAEVDGRIVVGDQLLELNEHILHGRSHLNAGPLILSSLISVLHKPPNMHPKSFTCLRFVLCRNPENLTSMAVAPLSYFTNSLRTSRGSSVNEAYSVESPLKISLVGRSTFEEVHAIRLLRGRNGFGFAIMNKSFTNEPGIYIKQLVENTHAALDGTLRAGDRILRVDWHDALHASYDSVLEWLRSARHQVRIVVSRVRLFTGENRRPDDEDPCIIRFRKRLSAPLMSSLINAFIHTSLSSTVSTKLFALEDNVSCLSSEQRQNYDISNPKASKECTISENCDSFMPVFEASNEMRRASCPDVRIPGFVKRPEATNYHGVVPTLCLTRHADTTIPVHPLGVMGCGQDRDNRANSGTAMRCCYKETLKRFAISHRGHRMRPNAIDCDKAELLTARPIYPGQRNLINIRKSSAHCLGIFFIGGRETSLGVLQVHEIFPEGAAAVDGRLRLGDRLLAVNNKSLVNMPYAMAIYTIAAAFSDPTQLENELDLHRVVMTSSSARHHFSNRGYITLMVERPGPGVQTKWYDQEVGVDLNKKPGRGLGICIVERTGPTLGPAKSVLPPSISPSTSNVISLNSIQGTAMTTKPSGLGVIVCDLIKGSTAQMDGRIQIGDQILAINYVDTEISSQEEVATLLKTLQGTVSLRLGRVKNQPAPLTSVDMAFRPEQ